MKTELKTLLMQSPMGQNQPLEGELVIKISLSDDIPDRAKHSAVAEKITEEGMKTAGYMMIDANMKVGELTDEDIIGCEPEQYMENGIIAGILDAIRHGLTENRGINFEYAVADAREKAETAVQVIEAQDLMDKVERIGLAIADTEGEA